MAETPLLVLSRAGSYSMDNKQSFSYKPPFPITNVLTNKARINVNSKLPSNFFNFTNQPSELI